MSFSEFIASIRSDSLRQVALHWDYARHGRKMPAWHDIQPAVIVQQLRFIWAYRYSCDSGEFIGRLAGNMIESIFGKSFRGTPMKELYRSFDYERLYDRAKRVVTEPALYRGEGRVFYHIERAGAGERIILPLAEDGLTGDGIMGATIYQAPNTARTAVPEESEHWFAL
jgi:Uncharacterized protein conserved in bacteria